MIALLAITIIGLVAIGIAVALLMLALLAVDARLTRRARRRNHTLTEREVAETSRPFLDPIFVWPTVQPRNGTAHESAHDPVE